MGRLNIITTTLITLTLATGIFSAEVKANQLSQQFFEKAKQALKAKEYKHAKHLCEQSIVADPADPAGFACLGRSLAKMGQTKKAERYYNTALKLEPNHINALVWGSLRDLSINRPDKAREKLDHLEKTCDQCEEAEKLRTVYLKYKAKKNAAKRSEP